MEIKFFTEELQERLKNKAAEYPMKGASAYATSAIMLSFVQELVYELQQFTYNYKFKDNSEEVSFFKEMKPTLVSQLYYYKKTFTILLAHSFKNETEQQGYNQACLLKLEHYLKKNNEFYIYCVTGQTYLNEKYFTRSKACTNPLIDPRFSTGYDDKLARLLANDLLKDFLQDKVRKTDGGSNYKTGALCWTASKTDLIELIYALHTSHAINARQIEIKEIVEAFEQFFQVDLGYYYDVLHKIRSRKKNQVSFLDSLRQNFLLMMEEKDK